MQNIAPSILEFQTDVPADLDPAVNPIIALHWYGIDPTVLAQQRRLQRLVARRRKLDPTLHIIGRAVVDGAGL